MSARKRTQGPSAVAVIVPAARDHYLSLTALAADVRAEADDSVHQMRVAARRLRSLLGTFHDLFPAETTASARDELRWLGSILGRARDAEVLADRFRTLLDAQPGDLVIGSVHQRLVGTQEDLYRGAHADAVDVLDGPRYAALCALLDDATSEPNPTSEARPTLYDGLDTAYRQLRRAGRKVRAVRRDGGDIGPALHRVRKRAKKLRYASEAVASAEPSAAGLGEAAKALQTVLGDHQDSVLARHWILDGAAQARDDDEDTFTYGLLYAMEEQRAAVAERELEQRIKAVRRAHRAQ
ncbi:CHAD domain-containing protein [Rhodococcus sp. ABRD24]|uniref:CHAD domain-containing protein n=1 Tax=Rhodococcus sp. ABRD24 TaxID=2507582 RepID=UPI00103D902B|nr:CHAD domain-containing protein [Rhodococcus sp. ABRD24]QBJ94939.1 CHAD domain-containing protein [Rhodococcus sp. ABRD24]